MKTQAYIISKNNELVAPVTTELKSGERIQYGWHLTQEMDGSEGHLINRCDGKISRAKKWAQGENNRSTIAMRSAAALDRFNDKFLVSDHL